ncbi:MAG: hypothetical protein V4538_17310 [Bacteroidota bacterium]
MIEYRFGFNGQEKDDEVSGEGNTMTATFWECDVRLGRRFNLDPKPGLGISEYACFANNPVYNQDIKGDSINLSKFVAQDKKDGTNYTKSLLEDLQAKTGLKLSVNSKGMLDYDRKAKINKEGTSSIFRDRLTQMIDDKKNTTDVDLQNDHKLGSHAVVGGNAMSLDGSQISKFIKGTVGVNKTTMGWALIFLHESFHSTGWSGKERDNDEPGHAEQNVNIVRGQLGKDYGERLNYTSIEVLNYQYIVFKIRDNTMYPNSWRTMPTFFPHVKF